MNLEIRQNPGLDQREICTCLVLLKLGSASTREINRLHSPPYRAGPRRRGFLDRSKNLPASSRLPWTTSAMQPILPPFQSRRPRRSTGQAPPTNPTSPAVLVLTFVLKTKFKEKLQFTESISPPVLSVVRHSGWSLVSPPDWAGPRRRGFTRKHG